MDSKSDDPVVGIGKNAMVAGDVRIHNTHVHAESPHKCDSCGKIAKEGMFECPDCRRTVCDAHYRPKPRLCERCADRRFRENSEALRSKAGSHPKDFHVLQKEIQRSAEYLQPTHGLLEIQLEQTKQSMPSRDRSGLSDRLKLAEARWSAGRRQDAMNQIEQICRDFGPEDETMNLFTRFKGALDPAGALAFISNSDWTTPARFLAEYSLESRAEGIDRLLEKASSLFPETPEVIVMQAADELLNALDLRESARLQKAQDHLQKLDAETWLPNRRMLESLIEWVKDTSRPPPPLDPANLLTPKLQKAIHQVRRSGMKSLRLPSPSLLGEAPATSLDQDQATNGAQPQIPQQPKNNENPFEESASSETTSHENDLFRTSYTVEESKPVIRFQLPQEHSTNSPALHETNDDNEGQDDVDPLPGTLQNPSRRYWSRNMLLASGLSGVVLIVLLCWAGLSSRSSNLQKKIIHDTQASSERKDSELPSKDATATVTPQSDSLESQGNRPIEDFKSTGQKGISKESDAGRSSPEVSSTEIDNAAAREGDKEDVKSARNTDESTHGSSAGSVQTSSEEASTNEKKKLDAKDQEGNETP